MSEASATELATRIAIDATELEHRLQAARDALEQKDTTIADLVESLGEANYDEPELRSKLDKQRQRIELLRATIGHAREKLEIYRDHSSGEYHGGIEHTALIRMIDESLSVTAGGSDPCKDGHDFVSLGDGTARCSNCPEQVDVSETGAARRGSDGDSDL